MGRALALLVLLAPALTLADAGQRVRERLAQGRRLYEGVEYRKALRELAPIKTDPAATRAQRTEDDRPPRPPPATPPITFEAGWSNLVAAIDTARSTGDIDDHAADELSRHAAEIADAYGGGDADKLREALSRFDERFRRAVDEDEISAPAADAIRQARSDVVMALRRDGALVSASPPPPPPEDEGDHGSDGRGHGNGPPAHAEANGHDGD